MGNALLPSRAHADARPRVHMRMAKRKGEIVGIAYRNGPTGAERLAQTIDDAFSAALANPLAPAVIIWEGIDG